MLNQSSQQYSAPAAHPTRSLDMLRGDLVIATDKATTLAGRARAIADDVFGSSLSGQVLTAGGTPGGVYVGAPPTNANGRAPDLASQVLSLNKTLDELSQQIDRLTCL